MFYLVDSLKRGGRFYLCWLADSWPQRFNAITHKQLMSQDIRQICADLMEVVVTESGRPANRFSLRLSSQLMRGLVRLYDRKATVFLYDLHMINANVLKHIHKKSGRDVNGKPPRRLPQLQPAAAVLQEEAVTEQRLEELIQNSGNVVGNIQDITLKEAVIPEFQLPPNDNFGEENPEQQLQVLADRTMEQMMQEMSAAQVSGLDLPQDHSVDKSAEKSRRQIEQHLMESIAEVGTPFRKSTIEDIQPPFEKASVVSPTPAEVPAVPEVPPPATPAPETPKPPTEPPQIQEPVVEVEQEKEIQEQVVQEPEITLVAEPRKRKQKERSKEAEKEKEQTLELEELEQQPAHRKRRVRTSLIIDKRIKLASDFLRARVNNPRVEMRVEMFLDDVVVLRVPADMLLHRPASGARLFQSTLSPLLGRLYRRNLGPATSLPLAERAQERVKETEQPRERRTRSSAQSEKIIETEEEPQQAPISAAQAEVPSRIDETRVTEGEGIIDVTAPNITAEGLSTALNISVLEALVVGEAPNVEVQDPQLPEDIADLPTQKLETLSQEARKRASDEQEPSAKRQRHGCRNFSKERRPLGVPDIVITEVDQRDKENIAPSTDLPLAQVPTSAPVVAAVKSPRLQRSQADAARMLLAAGLSDLAPPAPPAAGEGDAAPPTHAENEAKKTDGASEGSETPLGSLDRTKVSLGDPVRTTEDQMFIRNQWGVEGTMMKVITAIKEGAPVSVHTLVARGPVLRGWVHIIAARCFTSLLKLKQCGFIRIEKHPQTLEILNIDFGPKFDSM